MTDSRSVPDPEPTPSPDPSPAPGPDVNSRRPTARTRVWTIVGVCSVAAALTIGGAILVGPSFEAPHRSSRPSREVSAPASPLPSITAVARADGRAHLRAAGAPPTVYGHRGASHAAPENTLESDEAARRGGVEWIENDVQPSLDGVPHVLHDLGVDRTTDGTGPIRSLTAERIATLDAGSWFDPRFAGTRVPTLRAQLEDLRTRGGHLLLELKEPQTRDQIARVLWEVRDCGMTERVFVQSFDEDALRVVRELAPELPLGLLRYRLDPDPLAIVRELRLASYNPVYSAVAENPDAVAALHMAGVAVTVWTPNEVEDWAMLDGIGVDGIITDRPAELLAWIATDRATRTP